MRRFICGRLIVTIKNVLSDGCETSPGWIIMGMKMADMRKIFGVSTKNRKIFGISRKFVIDE